MAYVTTVRSFLGKGNLRIEKRSGGAGLRSIGNVPKASLKVTEEKIDEPEYRRSGGGNRNTYSRIKSVMMDVEVYDWSYENLGIGLRGLTTEVASGAVTNEEHPLYAGALIDLTYLPDPDVAITCALKNGSTATTWTATTAVTLGAYYKPVNTPTRYYKVTTAGTTAASEPTWPTTVGATVTDGTAVFTCMGLLTLTANTHFSRESSGILLLDSTPVTAGEVGLLGYTKNAQVLIEALMTSGEEYRFHLTGLNELGQDWPLIIRGHRVKWNPMSDLGLIMEKQEPLKLSAELLSDDAITDEDLSKFIQIQMAA